jgi:hypothetical protein
MTTNDDGLVWYPVDETSLKGETMKRLGALRKAQKASTEAKASFEESFIADARKADLITPDASIAFGYRFGKLAVAKTTGTKTKATSGKPKFSF